jgi:hypothetical protein
MRWKIKRPAVLENRRAFDEIDAGSVQDTAFTGLGHVETELGLGALGVGFCFALGALRGRFKRAQTADFIHDSLGLELAFQSLEGSVDGFSFADGHFGHFFLLSG